MADAGLSLLGGGAAVGLPMASGRWYLPGQGTNLGTGVPAANGREICVPYLIGKACTLNGIAIQVTSSGEVGSLIRLGLRYDLGGLPGAVIQDFGTITGVTVQVATLTPTQVLAPGWVWVSAAFQVAATTRPTVTMYSQGYTGYVGQASAGAVQGQMSLYQDGVSGALPGTFTPAGALIPSATPAVFLKAA